MRSGAKGYFMHRRSVLLGAAMAALFPILPAFATNAAENFVSANIQTGFDILNDKSLDVVARKQRFAAFLLGLTDVRRVALFLVGKYAVNTPPADMDAYLAGYQDYIAAVYQSYFAQYAGQSLHVASSRERAKDDFVVATNLTGSNAPLQIDFRVRTDGAKPVLVDLSVAGVWLAVAQRDEFTSVLSQSGGDIKALTSHLRAAEQLYR
jgi:phospholipid transport system substrate-binding protein